MRMMKGVSVLPGPTKLLAAIRATELSVPKYCEAKGLHRHMVEKAIKGKLDMSVAFAAELERATDGAVVVADWVLDDADTATGTGG